MRKFNDDKLHELTIGEFEYIISYCRALNIKLSCKHRQCLYNHSHKGVRQRHTDYTRIRSKAYYLENKEIVNIKHNNKTLDNKKKVIDAYGGECSCCGEQEFHFLTIDHIYNDGSKSREVEGKGSMIYTWLIKNNFPRERHQLLCMNCNFGKHMNHGICPNQKVKV